MARTQKHRPIAIGTPLGDDVLLLQSFSMSEQIGRLSAMSLELLSEDHAIDFDDIVGQNVTVRIETSPGSTRFFNGTVSTFAQRLRMGRLARYEATVVPWPWLLSRTSDCRIFQEMKVPDIIKATFRDHGFADFDDRLKGSYRQWEYCVQYRETDLNFVSRLMEQEGIYYFFEHENGKHTLILADSPSAHKPFPGYAEVSYRPAHQGTSDVEHVHDWVVEKRVASGAFALNDFDFKNPSKALLTESRITRSYLGAEFQMFDHPGEYTEFGHGEQYARLRIQELHSQHEVVRGQGDVRGIAAGCTFTLADHPRADQCREYLVTSSTVTGQVDEYDSVGNASGRGPLCLCSFTGIPASEPFRTTRITPKPVVEGPQTGIVVGKAGEEIYTDEHGRVKVHFHWDRRSKVNETSSCWIRVSQPCAGKKWGVIFIPRIGQEVIVEFLEGDPDRPIITGRVYNGAAMPPYGLPGEKTKSTIKTNSSKGGGGFNEIRFEDKKGKEQIFIHAQMDEDIRVQNKCREGIGNERHMIVAKGAQGATGDQLEKVEGDKHLTVEGDQNEKITGTVSLETGGDLHQKIGMNYSLETSLATQLKAGTSTEIEASTGIELKCGGSSIVLTPGAIFIQAPVVNINSGAGPPASAVPCKPEAPKPPTEADSDAAGQVDQAPPMPKPPTPATYSASAKVLKRAAIDGTPFCEECAAAAAAAAAAEPPPPPEPEPPPPPQPKPPKPKTQPPPPTIQQPEKILTLKWKQAEAWCSEEPTLEGTTQNYPDNEEITIQVKEATNGTAIASFKVKVVGNRFQHKWKVKDVLPPEQGGHKAEEMEVDATADSVKTPTPLKIRFVPNLPKTRYNVGGARFNLTAQDHTITIDEDVEYVKGWAASVVELGTHGGTEGGSLDGELSWNGYRWMKKVGVQNKFWNGTLWKNLPTGFALSDANNFCVGFYENGTKSDGSKKFTCQYGGDWPETFTDWDITATTKVATITRWTNQINTKWTGKFDLKREVCTSTDSKCCRYPIKTKGKFTKKTAFASGVLIIADGDIRSNSGLFFMDDPDAGTMPHEFGHWLGNGDEYAGATSLDTSLSDDGATAGIDATSIMGTSMDKVKKRHFRTISKHFANMVKTKTGKTWAYKAVAP